jgi:hypothetical protein
LALLFVAGLKAEDRQATQAALDRACELARQLHLIAERERLIQACQTNAGKQRSSCEREYATYGQRAGSRPALYCDLPICRRAFEYQRSYRRSE